MHFKRNLRCSDGIFCTCRQRHSLLCCKCWCSLCFSVGRSVLTPSPHSERLLFCPFCSWLNGAWWMQTASSTPVLSISTWLLGSATTLWLMLPPKPTSGLTVLSGSMTKLTTCQKPGWEVSSPPLDLLAAGGSLHPVLPSSVIALIHWHQLGFKSVNRTVYFF